MTPNSYLTLHILADGCVDSDITRAGRFLARCGCKYYNLTTASRYGEAEKIIRLIHEQSPNARCIWRGWPSDALNDGEIWRRVTPQEWVNFRIVPNIRWIKEFGVIPLTCNEVGVTGAEARQWAQWEADCIKLAYEQFQTRIAVMRFSTGNPLESEHDNYNSVLTAAGTYNAIVSPNEYTSVSPNITDRWHVGRYRWIGAQQDKLGVKCSEIVIGEYGIAKVNADFSLDPYNGYGAIGVNTPQHIQIIKHDGITYQEDDVSACWFVFGKWPQGKGSFGVENNEDLLAKVEQAAQAGELNKVIAQAAKPTVVPPANKGVGTPYTIDTLYNLRATPASTALDVGDVRALESITVYKDTKTVVGANTWHYIERATSPATESSSGWCAWPLPPEPLPETLPTEFVVSAAERAEMLDLSARLSALFAKLQERIVK